LSGHPEVIAEKEVLSNEKMKKHGAAAQLQWVREFLTQPVPEGCRAMGFKTKLKDVLHAEGLAHLLKELGPQIILLRRRNLVKLAISLLNADRLHDITGDWNLYNDKDRLPPVPIDSTVFSEYLKGVEKADRENAEYVQQLGLPTLALYYEDLLVKYPATLAKVLAFLDVSFRVVEGQALKTTNDDLRKAIANFVELRSHYVGTPYERMFDEVLV
jgi:hypothetical protein